MSEPDVHEWIGALCQALGVDPESVQQALVLDLARDVAHNVARPAAPLSAFVAGLAVGAGSDPATVFPAASALAVNWPR